MLRQAACWARCLSPGAKAGWGRYCELTGLLAFHCTAASLAHALTLSLSLMSYDIRRYVAAFLPRAVYTSGKSSSAAGLTASVVKVRHCWLRPHMFVCVCALAWLVS
jgi:hypothetical protein